MPALPPFVTNAIDLLLAALGRPPEDPRELPDEPGDDDDL